MEIKKQVVDSVEKNEKTIIKLSDIIWENAELAYKEFNSAKVFCDFLKNEGFIIQENLCNIKTAFKATYGNGKPVIGLLAEYDALSGLSQKGCSLKKEPIVVGGTGHGCGHNLLGSGCFGAALAIRDYLKNNNKSGTVIVYGCPAEEGGSGKTFMARDGAFDNLDLAISWHPGNFTGVVPGSTLANIQVKYKFTGKASHAAASPHLGRSALDAVELMDVGANYLREHIVSDAKLHYAIIDAGGISPNVVQPHAEVIYLIRANEIENVLSIKERVDKIAQGAALMTETSVDIEFMKACSNFLPNFILNDVVYDCMKDLGEINFTKEDYDFASKIRDTVNQKGPGKTKGFADFTSVEERKAILEDCNKDLSTHILPSLHLPYVVPGSTDVSDTSKVCPTAWFYSTTAANNTPEHSWQMVSQGKSSIGYKGMLYAAKVMAFSAIKFIDNPSLVSKAKEEYNIKMNNEKYKCPIPKDAIPKVLD